MSITKLSKNTCSIKTIAIKTMISTTLKLLGKGNHTYRKLIKDAIGFKLYFDKQKFHLQFVVKNKKEYDFWLYGNTHSKIILNLIKQEYSQNIMNMEIGSKEHTEIMDSKMFLLEWGIIE